MKRRATLPNTEPVARFMLHNGLGRMDEHGFPNGI